MMVHPYLHLSIDQPAQYRIQVQGWLGEGWEDWFEGMRLAHQGSMGDPERARTGQPIPVETTVMTGVVPDQAALLGILQKLYSFGFPILKVELVSRDEDRQDPGRGSQPPGQNG